MKKIHKNCDLKILFFISFIPLLSPYFRSSAFWANQENLAIFFVIISLIFFTQASQQINKINSKIFTNASLASLFSFLAFYSDQKMVFLVMMIYFAFILKNNFKFFIKFSLINFVFFIPALYLFYVWGNIVPVESQFRLSSNLEGLNILISNIGVYTLPIIFVLAIKKELKNYLKLDIINLSILIIFSILLLYFLPTKPEFEGNGIIFKLLSVISVKLLINFTFIKFIYFFINIIFLYFLLILFEKKIENIIFFIIFLAIFSLTSFTYQSYVDPLFFILMFGYFKMKNKINLVKI